MFEVWGGPPCVEEHAQRCRAGHERQMVGWATLKLHEEGRTLSMTEDGRSGRMPSSTLWLSREVSEPANMSISTCICSSMDTQGFQHFALHLPQTPNHLHVVAASARSS